VSLKEFHAPALIKFAVTGTISVILCFFISHFLVKMPLIKRIF
jgi:hypothetical protein